VGVDGKLCPWELLSRECYGKVDGLYDSVEQKGKTENFATTFDDARQVSDSAGEPAPTVGTGDPMGTEESRKSRIAGSLPMKTPYNRFAPTRFRTPKTFCGSTHHCIEKQLLGFFNPFRF
jgi:hypothetical protein